MRSLSPKLSTTIDNVKAAPTKEWAKQCLRLGACALALLLGRPAFTSPAEASSQSHFQAGLAYERLGRLEEAYTELQLASVLDSSNSQIALALGIVAGRLNRYDEALRSLEHSIALDAHSVASYYHAALIYEKQGRRDRAIESWERFLELSQDQELQLIAKKHIAYLEGHP